MHVSEAPPNARQLLGSLAELGHPDGHLLERLADGCEWLQVDAGDRIFTEGEAADGLYVLFEGRVRFVVESALSTRPWDADPPAVFGEAALLTGGGRSRTAVALRDSMIARLSPAMFDELIETNPKVALAVARRVASRTVFPAGDGRRGPAVGSRVTIVSPTLSIDELSPLVDAAKLAGGLDDDLVVVGQEQRASIQSAVRHSDRVMVVVDPSEFVDLADITDDVRQGVDPLVAPVIELALVRRPGEAEPRYTRRWLRPGRFSSHIHVRAGSPEDLARFGRYVGQRSVGLVLGGGGARGLAHIGVMRAMDELSIPIDVIGGSSMGAILGGQRAMGWSWESILEHNELVWTSRRLRWDVTIPTVSLFSGRRVTKVFEETFGDRAIEDFVLPYFCTTVDLSSFQLAIHRQGRAAQFIRASATAPGLWPPVVDDDGHLHIDGGQLNNVPTDLMRDLHSGPIIAVDVFSRQADMRIAPGSSPPIGLRHLTHRRSNDLFPSITETLNRCALLGSLQHQTGAREHADVYVTPDLSRFGFSAFERIHEICEVGYRAALDALAGWNLVARL